MQYKLSSDKIQSSIVNTLKYFDIFKFPLYFDEIHRFLAEKLDQSILSDVLKEMQRNHSVYVYNDLYMLRDDKTMAAKRIVGSVKADILMEQAVHASTIIASFPFVKAVCISGSLSKGYADEKSDIDYFIITQKNRLWITRSMLHLFKKFTFLLGRQHSYCMNYFIDESQLELEEQNIFTATELSTLKPLYEDNVYRTLILNNIFWLKKIHPNVKWDFQQGNKEISSPIFKKSSESILNLLVPKQLNIVLMHLTNSIWRLKWRIKGYPMQDYELAMKTKWYVSKNHPANYQKKVLRQYESGAVDCVRHH